MGASYYVHLEGCEVVAQTESALLINYDDTEYWIPRTQIKGEDTYDVGDEDVTISITEWIAKKKGIELE